MSYAPYSHFHVGAAVLTEDGGIYTAANQENAAYPACVCAERIALLYAMAHSKTRPVALAVTARTSGVQVAQAVTPCGECRQVLCEAETRYGAPIRILMCGKEQILTTDSATDLLPGGFSAENLHK